MKNNDKRADILRHALPIFHRHGFHATGVDTLLAESGISKRTLYKYFRSKEALIAAAVEQYQQSVDAALAEAMRVTADPCHRMLLIFDLKHAAMLEGDDSGCFAINAKLEYQGKDDAVEGRCHDFYHHLETVLSEQASLAGLRGPALLAQQLMVLFQGGVVNAQIHRDPARLLAARKAAEQLIIQAQ